MPDTSIALKKRQNIARMVDKALGGRPEVTSVYVLGSVASGYIDEYSDVDITIVCVSDILAPSIRAQSMSEIGSEWQIDTPSLDNPIWDSCDDGVVDGVPVSVHFQTKTAISEVLSAVVNKGAITTEKVPFRPYTVAALIQRAWLLRDKHGIFDGWLEQIRDYPRSLKLNILRHFTPLLREYTEDLNSYAERNLGAGLVIFTLARATDALKEILFALNEIYDPADKREDSIVLPYLARVPENFMPRLNYVLEGPFNEYGALERAELFKELAAEVLRMTDAQMKVTYAT